MFSHTQKPNVIRSNTDICIELGVHRQWKMERQRNLNETYSMSMVDFKVRVPITSQIPTLIATKALTGCAMQPDVVYAVGYSGKQNVINCNKIMPLVTFEL